MTELPKHILELTPEEKRNFLDSFDFVFSDIDGVLWNSRTNVPGAAEAFHNFRSNGKIVNFITNASARSDRSLELQLKKFGFDYNVEDTIHPAKGVIAYLKSINFDGLIFLIGGENFKAILRKEGFQYIDTPNIMLKETVEEMLNAITAKDPVRAVIIDHDVNISYHKLLRAMGYLRNPECLLIVGATDTKCPLGDGLSILGPGLFSKMIAEFCNREPIVFGKPGKELAKYVIKRFDIVDPKRALMIGDMLEQDIGLGKACGFQTLLVLSGGSKFEDMKADRNAQLLPDYYAESMGDFVEFVKDLHRSNI